ncbi:hypothetical protein [Microbulbifer sp. ALW1]|uniref:hypothetical protein n=1 Tax=Microbulbifer sp. (strain ALW1) TaxID=1516059 RepID=UPI001358FC17|nr:hypothetical protein [Microbulbifer sp. ALW1]
MNTQLPVNPQRSAKPAMLAAQEKTDQQTQNPDAKTGRSRGNLELRYPKELERCFVLGNN